MPFFNIDMSWPYEIVKPMNLSEKMLIFSILIELKICNEKLLKH